MRRRVQRGLAVWVVTLVVLGVVVIPPERCEAPTVAVLDAATASATNWLIVNQFDDHRWRYEYSRDLGEDLPGYNIVRHAGVMLALYMRHAVVGDEAAFTSAERGLVWIDDSLEVAGAGVTVREGRFGTTGGAGLF